jgi:putative alpha-1,2-mannosidase
MKYTFISAALLALSMLCGCQNNQPDLAKEPVDYVNNRIGNISHLLVPTYPTCHQPNSMVRMNPGHNEFVTDRMDGLPLNVPSHRQGSVLTLMPYCGDVAGLKPRITYRYDQEKTSPYKYSVLFDDYGVFVEFAPGKQSAMFSLTFEEDGDRFIQLRATNKGGEIKGEGNETWPRRAVCYRISRIDHLLIMSSKSGFISKSDQEAIDKMVTDKDPQFLAGAIIELKVKFTDKGLESFNRQLYMRPTDFDKVEGEENTYLFRCTEVQAINYFFKLAHDVEILAPERTRDKFIQRYRDAYMQYVKDSTGED